MRLLTDFVFLIFFGLVLIAWFVAWAVMHISSGGIHVLLGVAVIFLIIHLFRPKSAA